MSSPTKHELLALIEDRKNDLPRAAPALHPPLMEVRDDPQWRGMRQRERRITRIATRLDMAKSRLDQDFDQDFDMSS